MKFRLLKNLYKFYKTKWDNEKIKGARQLNKNQRALENSKRAYKTDLFKLIETTTKIKQTNQHLFFLEI